jgi:crotonobetaine/carnitine-CoA ligase
MPTPISPFGSKDLRWLRDQQASTHGERDFLTWVPTDGPERRWTYFEFARDVAALGAGLRRRGISVGDRVAILLDNSPEFLLVWTAVTTIGAVAVCLNTRSSRDELRYFGEHSGTRRAFTHAVYAEALGACMPELQWMCVVDASGELSAVAGDPSEDMPVRIGADAPASIQYTSGTTARPKAVVWSHANCLWGGAINSRHQELSPADVNLIHLPLFHTNALSYSFLGSYWAGSQIVLVPKFSASRFWDVAVRYRCTWTSTVSFCVRALASREAPSHHFFRGWASSTVTSAETGPGGIGATGWFGMTETVSHPICSAPGMPRVIGTMGTPAPEYQVAVVDDDGRAVDPGETGQLQVRGVPGVSLFSGYLRDRQATASAFTTDGWFRTGDRVRPSEDGTITFVERDKDVLKVGGENIGAPEIERVLLGVEGISEAAVVGRPDTMLGEVPIAFVLPRPQSTADPRALAEALRQRCAEMLPDFKRPREIRIVEELPRSTLDKIAKAVLRAQVSETAGPS